MRATSGVKFLLRTLNPQHAQRITLYQELSQIWSLVGENDDKPCRQSSQA